ILDRQLLPVHISSIEKDQIEIPMIDISVERPNFFANGSLEGKWDKLRGVVVGGPGQTKHHFLEKGELDYRLKEKILGTLDLSYTDESGIREIIQKSDELLRHTEMVRETKEVEHFFQEVVKDGLVTYGEKEVEAALEAGKVSRLLLSEGITWRIIKVVCTHCGWEKIFTLKDIHEEFDENKIKCESCGSGVETVEEVDYLDHLLEKAHLMGTETIVISTETEAGAQFYTTFGGIGALLRYK
ncbi:MAG: hypothetical protein U1C71_04775, partial [archaeon]|nr:hypothetical protein [archaeon]